MKRGMATMFLLRLVATACSGCVGLDELLIDGDPYGAPDAAPATDLTDYLDDRGCVRDERAHARRSLADPLDPAEYPLDWAELPDLDGDGEPERRWQVGIDCNDRGACSSLLYLSAGGCVTPAGRIDGEVVPLPSRHDGHLDLWTWWAVGPGEGSAQVLRWAGSGSGYGAIAFASCTSLGREPPLCAPVRGRGRAALARVVATLPAP